jgi:hypothetical protein
VIIHVHATPVTVPGRRHAFCIMQHCACMRFSILIVVSYWIVFPDAFPIKLIGSGRPLSSTYRLCRGVFGSPG